MEANGMDDLQKLLDAATPGPWKARENSHYWEIGSERDLMIGDACASNSIYRYGEVLSREESRPIAAANAALFAMAPDLAARVLAADRLIHELLAWAPPEDQARVAAEWEASK